MNSKRIYYILVTAFILIIASIIGGTYLATQQLQKQSAKLVEYKTQDQVLSAEQLGLAKAKKDIEIYSPLEEIAKTIVPQDKDQAIAVREIVKIAAASGIKPTAISFPSSTLGSPTVATGSSGSGTATKPAAGAATGTANKQALSQLKPVKGMSGVYNLQITVQQDSTAPVQYAQFLDFLRRLEQNRRTAHVTAIVLQPSATDRNLVSFTLTIDEFIKP